jgi:hypothetical protein
MAVRNLIWIVLASMAAAACGGGGGGGPPPPTGPSYNLAAGLANLAVSDVSAAMTVTGTLNGFNLTGSMQLTQTAAAAATFNAAPALMQATTVTGTFVTQQDGPVPGVIYSFALYTSSANATLGLDTNFNSSLTHAIADPSFEFPSSVQVGDSGVLGVMRLYLDGMQTENTLQVSYTVNSNPQNTDSVIVEVSYAYLGDGGYGGQTYQFDYVLTAAGTMTLQSLSITYPPPPSGGTPDMYVLTIQP